MLNRQFQNKTLQPHEGNPESPLHRLYAQKQEAERELSVIENRIARGDTSHEAVEEVQRLESAISALAATIARVSPLYTAAREADEKAIRADQNKFECDVELIAAFALFRYAKLQPWMADSSESWLHAKVIAYKNQLFRSMSVETAARQAAECLSDPRAFANGSWKEVATFPKPPAELIRYCTTKPNSREARA